MMNGTCSSSKKKWCSASPNPARIRILPPTSAQDTMNAVGPKNTAATIATTAIRAVQGTSGISRVVSSRARFDSMMRVPITAGTLQPKPSKIGKKLLPCSPIMCIQRSVR